MLYYICTILTLETAYEIIVFRAPFTKTLTPEGGVSEGRSSPGESEELLINPVGRSVVSVACQPW